jgi:ribonuclease-3
MEPLSQYGQLMVRPGRRNLIAHIAGKTGHRFADEALLVRSLTHKSFSPAQDSYEALEFLGDRVLAVVIAEELYRSWPFASTGELAQMFNRMVREETLAEVAADLGLGEVVFAGASDTVGTSSRVLGDVCEALIAAIYLDGGFATVRSFIRRHWRARLKKAGLGNKDAKTTLQEWLAAKSLDNPVYSEIERAGPDHLPNFSVAVSVPGLSPAHGTGTSKKQAEQRAAEALLRREGVWRDEG